MDPSVHRAIYNQRGICLAYIEFHNTHEVVVGWQIVETPEDAAVFAGLVAGSGRIGSGSTNVYGGVVGAVSYFAHSPCRGERVIDVSGDGEHNTGGEPPLLDEDIRVNALPILTDEPFLAEWYKQHIAKTGFVMPVESFDDFPYALKRKLAQEIAGK